MRPAVPPPISNPVRGGSAPRGALALAAWMLVAGGAGAQSVPTAESAGVSSSTSQGIFLPAADVPALWSRLVDVVQPLWPLTHAIEPDVLTVPPRPGLLESSWVEPMDARPQAWPPRRQRLVARLVPAPGGAWLDAVVETQSIGGQTEGRDGVAPVGAWAMERQPENVAMQLAARLAPGTDPAMALPSLDDGLVLAPPPTGELPWADSRFPRVARSGFKILEDYRNFYSCESLVCLTAAFGAGALMANTGFDTTMQGAWLRGVEPTGLGTFFSGCKDIGEGRYVLPIFGAAAVTGLVFEGNPAGDVVGEWGSRTLRMFVVGAPPLYVMQWTTGASRPADGVGSQWHAFNDNNGVSGHAFVGAIPFLAAADMVESPLLKGTLYVCSTFVGFSRMTDNAHYPSQVFLGWYLAWASSLAVSRTEMHFADMEVRVVPLPIADMGGAALEVRW